MPAELLWGEMIEASRAKRANGRVMGTLPMVNKISWQRAGAVTEPGRYMFTFGWLTVTEDDLAIWRQFPDATFTLVELPAHYEEGADVVQAEEFHLGTFELPIASTELPIITTDLPIAATH
jgi:hypothetical protein